MIDGWQKVTIVPLDTDLKPLLSWLQGQGIPCRVTEESTGQCLWVVGTAVAAQLEQLLQRQDFNSWIVEQGPQLNKPADNLPPLLRLFAVIKRVPLTLLMLLGGILGALLVELDSNLHQLYPFLYRFPLQGEWWRLITPVFLHFGIFHIAFNGLWIWEFGRRIETGFGKLFYLFLFVAIAVFSNSVQYVITGPAIFGGLSGVVYGFLGFLMIVSRRTSNPQFALPAGLTGFMLLWLAAGVFGLADLLIDGRVANGAHVGGLIAGIVIALIAPRGPISAKPHNRS